MLPMHNDPQETGVGLFLELAFPSWLRDANSEISGRFCANSTKSELDARYSRIFDGPTADILGEDEKEERLTEI